MGDFNARVGLEQASSAPGVVAKHAVDKQNQNGRRLVDFCLFNGFVITNTFFPHKSVHQTTWMHPKTKQWHMLDYVLVNRKFRIVFMMCVLIEAQLAESDRSSSFKGQNPNTFKMSQKEN